MSKETLCMSDNDLVAKLEHQNQRKKVVSLYELCVQTVSKKIERYPREAFSSISENDWEAIVTKRSQQKKTKVTGSSHPTHESENKAPPIAAKIMLEIEDVNPHLSESKVADEVIWRSCVEFKFKPGLERPKTLMYPWPILVQRLKSAGENLMSLLGSGVEPAVRSYALDMCVKESRSSKIILENVIITLRDSPMTCNLLDETKIGKTVAKCLKKISKLSSCPPIFLEPIRFDSVNGIKTIPPQDAAAKNYLEQILQSWKNIASENGVAIKKTSCDLNVSGNSSSREKSIPNEQEAQDIRVLEMCGSWKDLYEALTERRVAVLESHGAKAKQRRLEIHEKKHRVKQVRTARRSGKLGSILNGSNLTIKSNSQNSSKLNSWRREVTVSNAIQNGLTVNKRATNSFGAAVAGATKNTKTESLRKSQREKEIVLNNSKRMKMPNRDRDNNFKSNQLRNKVFRNY